MAAREWWRSEYWQKALSDVVSQGARVAYNELPQFGPDVLMAEMSSRIVGDYDGSGAGFLECVFYTAEGVFVVHVAASVREDACPCARCFLDTASAGVGGFGMECLPFNDCGCLRLAPATIAREVCLEYCFEVTGMLRGLPV